MVEDPFDEIDDDYGDREGERSEPSEGASGDSGPASREGERSEPSEGASGDSGPASREGDPFDRLSGPDDGPPPAGTGPGGDDSRPLADADASGTAGSDLAANAGADAPGSAEQDRSVDVAADPFGDVDVSRGDPFESADGPFQQVDVDSVDPDAVWDRFTEGAAPAEATEESLGGEDVPEDAPDVVTVPKGRFCQTCPHFSAPPEATCGHEGTELLTFVGTDEVRVSNCPVVRERRELGETFE